MGEIRLEVLVMQLGFGVLIFVAFMFLLKWVVAYQDKLLAMANNLLAQASEQNRQWQKAIDAHTAQAIEFHKQVTEAHGFQRTEHERMIKNLEALCRDVQTLDIMTRLKEGKSL